jgi:hypothetical protein
MSMHEWVQRGSGRCAGTLKFCVTCFRCCKLPFRICPHHSHLCHSSLVLPARTCAISHLFSPLHFSSVLTPLHFSSVLATQFLICSRHSISHLFSPLHCSLYVSKEADMCQKRPICVKREHDHAQTSCSLRLPPLLFLFLPLLLLLLLPLLCTSADTRTEEHIL